MGKTKRVFRKFLDDNQSREALINRMPPGQRDEYLSYKFLAKEAAFPGRVLVVYTLEGGEPKNIDVVTLWGMTVTRTQGPQALASSEGQGEYVIGVVPSKWRGRDLFMQIPLEFIFKWKGKESYTGVEFAPQYAILTKSRSKWSERIDGHTYCATLNDFRERFPGVPVRY